MASDRPDDATTPLRPPAPRDAEEAVVAMGHQTRNGLAAIAARAQMLRARLRSGDPGAEALARGLESIEGIAQRTAQRVEAIERPFHHGRPGGPSDVPREDAVPDRGQRGGP